MFREEEQSTPVSQHSSEVPSKKSLHCVSTEEKSGGHWEAKEVYPFSAGRTRQGNKCLYKERFKTRQAIY